MSTCFANGIIPAERVNVFISSAMNNEDGIDWFDIRKKVCSKLKTCPYINPFTIEEHAREISSTQYFLYKVQQCDILVLLVNEEIRPGVRQEIETARNNRKAIIPYFYSQSDPNSEANKLKKEFSESDYCTFKKFDSFDNLDEVVFSDLLHNIIDKYKYQHFLDSQTQTDKNQNMEYTSYGEPQNPITKDTINYFKSCYGMIANEIGYGYKNPHEVQKNEEKSLFHTFGFKILKWVMFGKDFPNVDEISHFAHIIKPLHNNSEWFIHRLNAITSFISNDVCSALKHEEEAFSIALNDNAPQWIINDILIDCRNLETQIKRGIYNLKYQQELDKRHDITFVPVLDRYVSDSYAKLLDEDIKLGTSLPGTYHFGGNIGDSLNKIENYIFMSLIYGSFTHLILAREILSKLTYKYGKIYDSNDLIYRAVKLSILSGDCKLLNNFVLKEWDNLYYLISANADELWLITKNVSERNQLNIKLLLIKLIGLYLNDINFKDVEEYLLEISENITWNDSSEYLKSIHSNISRLSHPLVITMLVNILMRNQVHLGSEISRILLNLDLDGSSLDVQSNLSDALEENLKTIIEGNGNPQFIAHLVKQNPHIFLKLEQILDTLGSLERNLYEINVGRSQDWEKVVLSSISDAKKQLKENSELNVVYGFGTNPFKNIQMVIKNVDHKKVIQVLIENFIPFAIEVLKSHVQRDQKEDCIDLLIDVVIILNERDIPIDSDLLITIQSLQIEKEKFPDFFSGSTFVTSMYRWIMLKTVAGLDVKKDILTNYLSYAHQQERERLVLAQCINQYMVCFTGNNKEIEELFLLMTLEICNDKYFLVRKEAANCLVYLLKTKYSDIAKQKLISLTTDASPNVRGSILNIIENDKIDDIEFRDEVLLSLCQDANYGVRKFAERIKSSTSH